ncbi:MAG: tetratricopeptide repeat protein [Flavobacteriaceae bacterium]|nr:tetratricopeptide repeat protein [Flavobacteriaceae bacterium]
MRFALALSIALNLFQLHYTNAQNQKKLDSLLNSYPEKNKRVDSLINAYRTEKKDSLKVDAIYRLYYVFLYKEPYLAKLLALEQLKVSKHANNEMWIASSNYYLGSYFQNSGKLDSAKYYYEKSLEIYKRLNKDASYASTLSALAVIDDEMGHYESSIEKYAEVLNIYKRENLLYQYAISKGDRSNVYIHKGFYKIAFQETLDALRVLDTVYEKPWRKADAQRQLAQIEYLRKNYENALKYFKKSSKIYRDQKDNVYLSSTNNDIGNIYFYLRKYDSAMHHLNEGLKLARKFDIAENEGNALSHLGRVYTKKGQFKTALEYLYEALKIHEEQNYNTNILRTQNDIANTYLSLEEPEKTIFYSSKTIEKATGKGPINELKNAHQYRFQAYYKLGNLKKALEDQLIFQKLKDSIFDTKSSQQIEELSTIYETEKKEQQIALQENEIELLEQKAKINALQKSLLGGGLLLSLGLVGFGFYGFRQKIKRNKLEKEKVDAELAFKRKELTTHALHLAKKNEVLESLKQKAEKLKEKEASKNGYQQLIRTINFDLRDDNNWENFSRYFQEVHKDFNTNVKQRFPNVTSNELRLMSLIKMNLSSKEIANILNITQEGIKKARYRLRKKLNITTENSLQDFILSI